jgi:metallo-beta-lactamase family protein
VTGSCYRVVHARGQFLVDCGMFQGNKTVRDLNYKPLPFEPKAIDFLLLTHAHIDHCRAAAPAGQYGLSQADVGHRADQRAAGISCCPTRPASRRARRSARRGSGARRAEEPFEPLYVMEDASRGAEAAPRAVKYEEWIDAGPGRAGALLERRAHSRLGLDRGRGGGHGEGKAIRILFSGDLGPDVRRCSGRRLTRRPGYDYILSRESTYGGREREDYTRSWRGARTR